MQRTKADPKNPKHVGASMPGLVVIVATQAGEQIAAGQKLLTAEMLGMTLGHLGVAVFVIGVMLTESLSVERDVRLEPGQEQSIGDYRFRFIAMRHFEGPNFRADEAQIQILKGDDLVAELRPQKRGYQGGQVMTEAAIDPGLMRDLYVALGEPVGANDAWAVRLYYKPMIRWIWLGAIFMTIGGIVSASERRLYRRVELKRPAVGTGEVAA